MVLILLVDAILRLEINFFGFSMISKDNLASDYSLRSMLYMFESSDYIFSAISPSI